MLHSIRYVFLNLKGFTVMPLGHKFGLRKNEESDVGIFNPKFLNFNLVKSASFFTNGKIAINCSSEMPNFSLENFLNMHQSYLVQI